MNLSTVYTRTVAKMFCYLEGWLVWVDLIVIQFIEQYSRITDETPRTGYWILHTWLSPSLALYIFYMPPYKLFSTARSCLFGSDQIILHHVRDIFYRYNSTHTVHLQFYVHKSTPAHISLRFTFMQIPVVFLFFILSFIFFTSIHCAIITLSYFTLCLLI